MKTSTWHHQWVIGLYTSPTQVERVIAQAEADGIPLKKLVVMKPEMLHKRRFFNLRPEPHHPEWRWIRRGALLGLCLGASIGYLILQATAYASAVYAVAVFGVGGAVIGGFFGLLSSGADASLHAFYEESGIDGKIMVAIHCQPHHEEEITAAKRLIHQSGVEPRDFPHRAGHA